MTKKLYVGNLPFTAEDGQLQALFGANGRQVTSVRILNDKVTGRSRGFAFVEMANPEDAQRAIEALNGREFMGRPLTVMEAREQTPRTQDDRGGFGSGGRNFGRKGFGTSGGRGSRGSSDRRGSGRY